MKHPQWLAGATVMTLASISCFLPASAELPSLEKQPWLGYYAVAANKRFQFTVSTACKIAIIPIGDGGDPVAMNLVIPIDIAIEETMPDGKTVVKQIQAASLESAEPATDKLEKCVIRGKVTGDAVFEVTLEQGRGGISMGGRVVEAGSLKNPLRFAIRANFPNAYPRAATGENEEGSKEMTKEEKRAERKARRDAGKEKGNGKEKEDFGKKIEKDRIELRWTDGTRRKQPLGEEVDASSKEINGPGITGADIEIGAYQGREFLFLASPDSSMRLSNDKPAPLFKGYTITWAPDAAKDKDGRARLSIEVK